jgi:hypothetical protein
MSQQEAERRRHQGDRANSDAHRIMSFRQWCELNGISLATGRRIISAGIGPVIIQLSARRIGITFAANAAWQASRARGVA